MVPPEVKIPSSAANQRERFASTYQVLNDAIAGRAFPGCSFGVQFSGEVVALDGLGRFTYEADAPVVTPSTVYDLASLTKPLAATSLAMILYDRNLLTLDQPVGKILPAFVAGETADSPRHRVTVRMLLDHSSGLPGYAPLFQLEDKQSANTPELIYDAALRLPLEAEPGTRVEYSDIGFIVLTRLLESLATERIDTVCHREVFQPLCMDSTRFHPLPGWGDSIPPTEQDDVFRHRTGHAEVHDENAHALGGVSGHAGLFSNGVDCLRYSQCLLSGGRAANGDRIFKPETITLFTKAAGQPAGSSRALGWDTPSAPSSSGHYFSSHSVGHLGFTGTSLWIDLDAGLAGVLLTNRTWPNRENQKIREVRPRFYDSIAGKVLPTVRVLSDVRTWVTS